MRLTLFRVVALDHAHAAEGLREPTRHFRVDLAPLSEDGPNRLEPVLQHKDKHHHHREHGQCDLRAEVQQKKKHEHGREHAAHKIHQACAHQVAHAFHVRHDARHQRARAVFIVVSHRQKAHVLLHLTPHLGDQTLPCF